MTLTNQKRAVRCRQAITAYSDDDSDTNLVDFLADAMHLCDANGEDFGHALAVAGKHYLAELNDEQLDERKMP
jgi:hypothetical protein